MSKFSFDYSRFENIDTSDDDEKFHPNLDTGLNALCGAEPYSDEECEYDEECDSDDDAELDSDEERVAQACEYGDIHAILAAASVAQSRREAQSCSFSRSL